MCRWDRHVATRRLNDSLSKRFRDGFALRMDLEFGVDVLEMKADGVDRNAHHIRSRFVVMPLDKQLQQLRLLRRESIRRALGRTEFAKEPHDPTRHLWRHWRTSVHGFGQGLQKPRG